MTNTPGHFTKTPQSHWSIIDPINIQSCLIAKLDNSDKGATVTVHTNTPSVMKTSGIQSILDNSFPFQPSPHHHANNDALVGLRPINAPSIKRSIDWFVLNKQADFASSAIHPEVRHITGTNNINRLVTKASLRGRLQVAGRRQGGPHTNATSHRPTPYFLSRMCNAESRRYCQTKGNH